MTFRLNLNPPTTTHHAKQIVRRGAFTGLADRPGLANARATYCALLSPHRPPKAFDGPVCLSLIFTFPWRKSESKKTIAQGSALHVVKPDCSNLAKTLEDCLCQMGFIQNDSQVCCLHVSKRYGDNPGIDIEIDSLKGQGVS